MKRYKYIYIFFTVFSLIFLGCAKIDELTNFDYLKNKKDGLELRKYSGIPLNIPPLVVYIVDRKDVESLVLNHNIRKICDYTKIPVQTILLEDWNKSPKIDDNVRVLSVMDTKRLSNESVQVITEFVAKGGTLYLPFGGEDERFSYLVGMKPDNIFQTSKTAQGFYFNYPMLPGLKDKVCHRECVFFGLKKEAFSDSIKVLCTAVNEPDYPVILENRIGKGRVFYYNSTYFFVKEDRGLLFAGILKGLEGIPYPVNNTGVIFLDDFPCPLYDNIDEPVKSEFNYSVKDYVQKIWWPDLLKLSKKHNLSYTAMTTFDYTVNTKPPFLFREWDSKKIKINNTEVGLSNWLVNDVIKNGHELAFHGYNHVSLTVPDWKNPDFMVTSLKAAEKKWAVSDFGELPVTYVPPSNIIDRVGVRQLKKAMPSIKFMCSLLASDKQSGGGREFDFDPYEPELFDFPRISSGFYLNEDHRFLIHSLYLYTGIWTHFVHPDDIYQINDGKHIKNGDSELRNEHNLGWYKTPNSNRSMYSEFDKLITEIKKDFPLIRFMSAKEGALMTNDWRASYFNHVKKDGLYTVEKLKPEESNYSHQTWFLYGSVENAAKIEKQLKSSGATFIKKPFMDGFLYSISTSKPKLTVPDLLYESDTDKIKTEQIVNQVKVKSNEFSAEAARLLQIQLYGESDEIEIKRKIDSLRKRMDAEPKIEPKTWIKYAQYLSWGDKGDEIWPLFEQHCIKYPFPENILFSKKLAEIVYYPNELIYEKWLNACLLVTPNDKDLLNSYVTNFYTAENQEKIKNALITLLKVDTSKENFMKYVDFLLGYEPQNAIPELDKISPSEEYRELATTIAWAYADNNQYAKAYEWSKFSNEIDFHSVMNWLMELKNYPELLSKYNEYIEKNPDDYRVKALMCMIYHDMGKFKEAWILASSLPEIASERDEIQKTLNTDVEYEEREIQLYLAENYSNLFYPDVLEKILKNDRKQYGNYINYFTSFETNRENLQTYKNVLSYSIFDKKLYRHTFGLTYSSMYRIAIDIPDYEDNRTHDVLGFEYQFNNPKSYDKLQYWSRIRYEYSLLSKSFFQFGAGANYSKNKSYSSAELKIAPAETGPSLSKSIYRFQLTLYQEYYFFKYLNTILALEGNYFTKSKQLNNQYYTNESLEGSITGKFIFDRWQDKKYRFQPSIEATRTQASLGETNLPLSSGYPYWMIDDRFYIGGGLGFSIGKPEDDFKLKLEGSWFYDDYANDFSRFTGNMDYQIFDYTALTSTFEFYLQSKFYSNALQIGIKHNLKRKQKK